MAKVRQSEWGRLNAGQEYGILAVDVDRALGSAGLGEHQQRVMQAIREHSWGTSARRKKRGDPWPDAEPCQVNLKGLAEALGVKFQRLYEARRWLVNARMVVVDNGLLSINKNADEWIDPATGRPLLNPKALVYATIARTRKDGCVKPPDFTTEPGESEQPLVTLARERHSRPAVTNDYAPALTPFTRQRERDSRASVNGHTTPPLPEVDGGTCVTSSAPIPPLDPPIRNPAELEFEISEEEEGSPNQPTYSKPDARDSGGLVGGLGTQSHSSTETTPIPRGLAAVTAEAGRLPGLSAFAVALDAAWSSYPKLASAWRRHPDAPAWSDALVDLGAEPDASRTVPVYVAIVRRLARSTTTSSIPRGASAPRGHSARANAALRDLKARLGMEAES
jgi:hypothetical protein